jgi:pterin-4a-carbinolamine dehydratase
VTTTDGEKFAARCQAVASEAGWPLETTATGEKVLVEVHTKDVKGLTINDFILATKIEADEEVAAMIVKKAKVVRNWI